MAALAGIFLLALQAPPLGDLPVANRTNAVEALIRAHIAVAQLGHCTEELPARDDLEETYQDFHHRAFTASEETEELYPGAEIDAGTVTRAAGMQPRCDDASLDAYVAAAQRHLVEAEALVRADTTPRNRGLWLGTLRLCGDRVEAVSETGPEHAGDSRRVVVRFSAAFAPRVRGLTQALVNRRLSIVLDGTTLVRATVMEPISWSISITAPDTLPVEAFRRAAATPC